MIATIGSNPQKHKTSSSSYQKVIEKYAITTIPYIVLAHVKMGHDLFVIKREDWDANGEASLDLEIIYEDPWYFKQSKDKPHYRVPVELIPAHLFMDFTELCSPESALKFADNLLKHTQTAMMTDSDHHLVVFATWITNWASKGAYFSHSY